MTNTLFQLLTIGIVGVSADPTGMFAMDSCSLVDGKARVSILDHVRRDSGVPLDVPLQILSEHTNAGTSSCRLEIGTPSSSLPFKVTYYLSSDGKSLSTNQIDISESVSELDAKTRADFAPYIASNRWHSTGSDPATKILVLFYDFECPYCARIYGKLKNLAIAGSDIRLAVVNFPLEQHVWAGELAKLSECAGEQNVDAFWTLNDYIFAHQADLKASGAPRRVAEEFLESLPRIDSSQLSACLAAPGTEKLVSEDKQIGIDHGVKSTPTVFVNGTPVSGFRDVAELQVIMNDIVGGPDRAVTAR